jgi:hypothetical protein
VNREDIVTLSEEGILENVPGCLSFYPYSGMVLRIWETRDGFKLVDVWCAHEKTHPHETTYHQDFVRAI